MVLPESAPWLEEFKAAILAFPDNQLDDQGNSVLQFRARAEPHKRFPTRSGRLV